MFAVARGRSLCLQRLGVTRGSDQPVVWWLSCRGDILVIFGHLNPQWKSMLRCDKQLASNIAVREVQSHWYEYESDSVIPKIYYISANGNCCSFVPAVFCCPRRLHFARGDKFFRCCVVWVPLSLLLQSYSTCFLELCISPIGCSPATTVLPASI